MGFAGLSTGFQINVLQIYTYMFTGKELHTFVSLPFEQIFGFFY